VRQTERWRWESAQAPSPLEKSPPHFLPLLNAPHNKSGRPHPLNDDRHDIVRRPRHHILWLIACIPRLPRLPTDRLQGKPDETRTRTTHVGRRIFPLVTGPFPFPFPGAHEPLLATSACGSFPSRKPGCVAFPKRKGGEETGQGQRLHAY